MIVDHTNRRVLEVLENRDKDAVKAYLQAAKDGGLLAHVEEVTTDMWEAYGHAAREVFGSAVRVTVDRFHVMQQMQKHLAQARREIQRGLPKDEAAALKGSRWLWVTNEENLSPEQRRTLEQLCQSFPALGALREQRESLRAMFEDGRITTQSGGLWRIGRWVEKARMLGLKALDRFCQTLERWREEIANYFVSRASNGPTEGFNRGLRGILSRACGMRNFLHFRARVLHAFGYPRPQEST